LFLVLGVAALYFYLRGKKLQEKIEIEMRDVTVGDTGVNTYRRVAKPAANYDNFAEEQD